MAQNVTGSKYDRGIGEKREEQREHFVVSVYRRSAEVLMERENRRWKTTQREKGVGVSKAERECASVKRWKANNLAHGHTRGKTMGIHDHVRTNSFFIKGHIFLRNNDTADPFLACNTIRKSQSQA